MPGIVPLHVLEDLALGRGVDARGEVVEQQHARIERQRPRQHDALLLAARQAGAALRDDGVEPLRQRRDEVLQLGGRDRLLEVLVASTVLLKAMFSRSVRLNIDRVLEDEADLLVQRCLVVVVDAAAVVLDACPTSARAGRSAGYSSCVLPAAVGPMTAVLRAGLRRDSDTSFSAALSPNVTTTCGTAMSPRRSAVDRAACLRRRRVEHRARCARTSALACAMTLLMKPIMMTGKIRIAR